MALPVNIVITDGVTVIPTNWGQGLSDWVNGAYGVLGATYTPTAFRTALGSTAVGDAVFIAASAAAARTAIGAASSTAGATGLTLISRQTAAASATIDFTSISNTVYDSYLLVCDSVISPINSTVRLRVSVGGVFQTGLIYTHNHLRFTAGASAIDGSVSDTSACISSAVELLAVNEAFFGEIKFSNCSQTTAEKRWLSNSSYIASAPSNMVDIGGGRIATTSAIDGFRFFIPSANITSGTFTLYGLQKA